MKMKKSLMLILAIALMLIGAACSAGNEGGTDFNTPADNSFGVEQNDSAVDPEDGALEDNGADETEDASTP